MQRSKIPSTSLNLFSKFLNYTHKYGFVHTVFTYIGRYNTSVWKLTGSLVTRPYLEKYLATSEQRIINLGGGGNCIDGCLTVDINPRADAYVDITKRLPFDDNSIDAIFCEEVIEHIDLQTGISLLQECCRILKPGGILRIITPDLNWFAERLSKSIEACDEINDIFYGHDHRYIFTQLNLEFYCKKAGFENLKKSKYQDLESKLGYLDSHPLRFNHPPEISQYLEMTKSSDKSLDLPIQD